jgi:hypothetical protein
VARNVSFIAAINNSSEAAAAFNAAPALGNGNSRVHVRVRAPSRLDELVGSSDDDDTDPLYVPGERNSKRGLSAKHKKSKTLFEVDSIIDIRNGHDLNGAPEQQLQVCWTGYYTPTWEPLSTMEQQVPDLVRDFMA